MSISHACRLDLSEIQALARDLQPELSADEVKEAFKVLDEDNSRYIELPGGCRMLFTVAYVCLAHVCFEALPLSFGAKASTHVLLPTQSSPSSIRIK